VEAELQALEEQVRKLEDDKDYLKEQLSMVMLDHEKLGPLSECISTLEIPEY
jgi:hypothetical protein